MEKSETWKSTETGKEGNKKENNNNEPPPKNSYIKKGDLVDYETTQMDIKLAELFDGEYVLNYDCTHLDSGIVDDKIWQVRYTRIIVTL